ncbi:hypothetical protein K504DRAFT_19951 [Pleomassaria siparia CBS 279.74]|uniref:Uncharacterized protein n=1 Tax=Pleomassaria siparia CBS 279.74 TaxID=1314801 RepID=A0A6G1KRY6_9PLEO|nr:hypothetical protein K504DRAFT_19951 [Pleomassaria siparia CBS 279.74]
MPATAKEITIRGEQASMLRLTLNGLLVPGGAGGGCTLSVCSKSRFPHISRHSCQNQQISGYDRGTCTRPHSQTLAGIPSTYTPWYDYDLGNGLTLLHASSQEFASIVFGGISRQTRNAMCEDNSTTVSPSLRRLPMPWKEGYISRRRIDAHM